jgi:hypothetical protein
MSPKLFGPNVSECNEGSVNLSTQRQNPYFAVLSVLIRTPLNLNNPVLAHRCSLVLLESRALSCSAMVPFATLWPVFGQ